MSGSTGWDSFWYDINSTFAATPSAKPSLLLGGEVSMWTDTYCAGGAQCGASSGPNPVATKLFPPSEDDAFATSVGGMIFPRALVGAGSFWRYDASVNASSPEFADSIWKLNDRLRELGAKTCPSKCACDQLTQCGKAIPLAGEREGQRVAVE